MNEKLSYARTLPRPQPNLLRSQALPNVWIHVMVIDLRWVLPMGSGKARVFMYN